MKRVSLSLAIVLSICLLSSCARQNSSEAVRIAINPWPGYEFLYLADQKGFFEAEGLNVELLELASLADVKRVFEQERADGMASTAIEAVQVATSSTKDITIVLVPDYSNGGDIIVARDPITKLEELKGKKVGVEIGLLGTYILSRAMETAGLKADDVIEINVEQLSAEEALMAAGAPRPIGFRASTFTLTRETFWAFDVLVRREEISTTAIAGTRTFLASINASRSRRFPRD